MVAEVGKAGSGATAWMKESTLTVRLVQTSSRLPLTSFTEFLTENRVENQYLRVHLWDISGDTPRFYKCNCNIDHSRRSYDSQRYEVNQRVAAPGWQPVQSAQPAQPFLQGARYMYAAPARIPPAGFATVPPSVSVGPNVLQDGLNNLRLHDYSTPARSSNTQVNLQNPIPTQSHDRRTISRHAQQAPVRQGPALTQSTFVMGENGTPVNTTNGVVTTEARGVFASGLSYKARKEDVQAYFSTIGPLVKFEMPRDSLTGKPKGFALMEYASARHAAKAARDLDRKIFKHKEIHVRVNKDPTPVDLPAGTGPVIVNGSQSAQVRLNGIDYTRDIH